MGERSRERGGGWMGGGEMGWCCARFGRGSRHGQMKEITGAGCEELLKIRDSQIRERKKLGIIKKY